MLRKGAQYRFGIMSAWRSAASTFKEVLKVNVESSESKNSNYGHTSLRFEDESSEWQALIVENPYELNIFQETNMPQLQNFGTVDNPHLVYTSEIPFRFVACPGPPSEDDFESHELMWFLLREGPLQRCQGCGQVFKLVRLRDELTPENDYYRSGFCDMNPSDYVHQDNILSFSLIRPFMFFTTPPSNFVREEDQVYTLMRHQDHDRYLTDPAYRMEQDQLVHQKAELYYSTLADIDRKQRQIFGQEVTKDISKEDYANLVETEKAIHMLNRHFKRVQRYKFRAFLDPSNHQRREDRMFRRKLIRDENETFYLEGGSAEHQEYLDYYETDVEVDREFDQDEKAQEASQLMAHEQMKLKNFDFHER